MALTRRIARPLLASMFIAGGIDALRHPEGKAKAAEVITVPLARQFPALPDDPELLVRVNGAVQVGAGVLLALGHFRRLAAIALIASIIPTTYAGHRFWAEEDESLRALEHVQFLKNLGLLGGLILAAADTEGEPSLGWRARRHAARIGAAMALGKTASSASARNVGDSMTDGATMLARHAAGVAGEVGRDIDEGISRTSSQAREAAVRVARQVDLTAHHLAETLPGTRQQLVGTLAESGERAAHFVTRALAP